MEDISAATAKCRELVSRGSPIEHVLAHLREVGLSKGQSIRVLVEAAGYRLREAKELVHSSAVWSDVRDRDDQFHDELLKNLESLPEDSSD